MDSRELYSSAKHLTTVIKWSENWIHFGIGTDLKRDLVRNKIINFLEEEPFHFVHKRDDSASIQEQDIFEKIEQFLGISNFQLWNCSMNRAIQFNEIGVMMTGKKCATE